MRKIRVGTFQGNAIYDDVHKTLEIIGKTLRKVERESVEIICFPECYLQGYILDEAKAKEVSLNLNSSKFRDILNALYSKTTIILGLIEEENKNIYNTAAVIEKGKLVGKYRKQHLLKKEYSFTAGNDSPIFFTNHLTFGINICSDTRYEDSVIDMAHKGAKVFFFPLNNSLPHETALKWKDKHLMYWQNLAKKTKNWVFTSDVIEESQDNTGFGFATIIDTHGNVIQSVEHLKEGILTHIIKV